MDIYVKDASVSLLKIWLYLSPASVLKIAHGGYPVSLVGTNH